MSANNDIGAAAARMKAALQPSADCIPLERIGGPLSETDRAHVQGCLRCQTELRVWEMADQEGDVGEGAAVRWIAAELKRRRATAPAPRTARLLRFPIRTLTTLAAAAVFMLAVGYLAWDREPTVGNINAGAPVYRAAQLQVIAPLGDVPTSPRTLDWSPVDGAVRYEVTVLQVDRTEVWRTTTASTEQALPEAIVALCVPGRTLLWTVTARDRSGTAIAESGTQRFRVSTQ